MAERPLIVFPRPRSVTAQPRVRPRPPEYSYPSVQDQVRRLEPQIEVIEAQLEQKNADRQKFHSSISGLMTEFVLVLELLGDVPQFQKAVQAAGMEWMGEADEEDVSFDEDFARSDTSMDPPRTGKVFLAMSRVKQITSVLQAWKRFKQNPDAPLPRGMAKWGQVFQQLREVRLWDWRDRIENTGIRADWQQRMTRGDESALFEAELWPRQGSGGSEKARGRFEELLRHSGGQVLHESIIPDIAYHGILARAPIGSIEEMFKSEDVAFLKCD